MKRPPSGNSIPISGNVSKITSNRPNSRTKSNQPVKTFNISRSESDINQSSNKNEIFDENDNNLNEDGDDLIDYNHDYPNEKDFYDNNENFNDDD